MKHKSKAEKARRQDEVLARLQARYDKFTRQNEAGEQLVNALAEQNNILNRLKDLKDQDKENSQEYQQLEQRCRSPQIIQ